MYPTSLVNRLQQIHGLSLCRYAHKAGRNLPHATSTKAALLDHVRIMKPGGRRNYLVDMEVDAVLSEPRPRLVKVLQRRAAAVLLPGRVGDDIDLDTSRLVEASSGVTALLCAGREVVPAEQLDERLEERQVVEDRREPHDREVQGLDILKARNDRDDLAMGETLDRHRDEGEPLANGTAEEPCEVAAAGVRGVQEPEFGQMEELLVDAVDVGPSTTRTGFGCARLAYLK